MVMVHEKRYIYGTSGFRADATLLEPVVRRTAFYAATRAKKLGKAIGLMITASHNPIADNGIKMVDPNGQMLPLECENQLTDIVNTSDENFEKLKNEWLSNLVAENGGKPMVVIATDTRPSSPKLLCVAMKEINSVTGVRIEPFENYTTPQLHFIVRGINIERGGDPYRKAFVSRFRDAFVASLKLIPPEKCSRYTSQLFVDCANGVGALWVDKYLTKLNLENELQETELVNPIHLTLLNTDTQSRLLNHECGADYVKIGAKLPANFDNVSEGARCASLDGDADRLVYFYPTKDGEVVLLDGDHIAALFARFLAEQFSAATRNLMEIPLTLGVVQTAYANGNSTRYFSHCLGLKPVLTKTGVKYLEEAARKFDVGIYFEANGHGTVCFSGNFYEYMHKSLQEGQNIPRHLELLSLFPQLVNEVVGDGIADLLAVECLLRYFDWSVQDWLIETYQDIPSVQKKVQVNDRSIYVTADDCETILIKPDGMQAQIDSISKEFKNARAFIRPSGTEPIVRVYAEAESDDEANQLAQRLVSLIETIEKQTK